MNENDLDKIIASLPQTDNKTEPHILDARRQYPRSHMAWSEIEEQVLTKLYENGSSIVLIAQKLKRSFSAVKSRLEQPSIENQKETITSPEAAPNFVSEPGSVRNMLQYWRNSLADEERLQFSFEKMRRGKLFLLSVFKNAQLPPEEIKSFFDEAEANLKKNPSKQHQKLSQGNSSINKLPVIIAPYKAVKNSQHGKKINSDRSPDVILPLWIAADLTKEGKLMPSAEFPYPWIERNCLISNDGSDHALFYPILGDIAEIDAFYTKNKHQLDSENLTWDTWFSWAENLLKSLLQKNPAAFSKQNYLLLEEGYIAPLTEVFDASRYVTAVYDEFIFNKNKTISPLLTQFCSLETKNYCGNNADKMLFMSSQSHVGQTQNEYPLSDSQRTTLSYFFDPKDNAIFTVNGPPGTGKTSLLLSVIASKWVQAAILEQSPPLIVATSTNNLAIANILEHLNKANGKRWLPNIQTFGLYLISSQKAKAAEESQYLYRLKEKGSGSLEKFYSSKYQEYATHYFLEQFNRRYHQEISDIEACQKMLHAKLIEKHLLLNKAISQAYKFHEIREIFAQYGSLEAISTLISTLLEKKTTYEEEIKKLKILEQDWLFYKTEDLKWIRLIHHFFSAFVFVRSFLKDKIKLFTLRHKNFFPGAVNNIEKVDEIINTKMKALRLEVQSMGDLVNQLLSVKDRHTHFFEEKATLENELGFEFSLDNLLDFSDSNSLLSKLDVTLRYNLFSLATHYWEATWLMASKTADNLPYSKEGRRKYWEIQAMLAPCFVTTLQSGPAFFKYQAASYDFEALSDFIDLLIIDEAGQARPALAGALILAAKNLLLVGDAKQIEPIFSITEVIDSANAKKFQLCEDANGYEQLKGTGILCSGNTQTKRAYGNLITVGQRQAKYHLAGLKFPGLLLKEHRRCAKEIISYCNELCYDNQLIIMTPEKPFIYPRMGYAHIKGHEELQGSSRFNRHEACAIAAWIVKNKQAILTACQASSLDECIGIVTPFAAQSRVIQHQLREHGLTEISKVGTVHTLQGAEKPIIIFSPVYTSKTEQTSFYFDRSSNMLNVAVSRAKMSFLVFGDMEIFDTQANYPSSLLAKYLFAQEENEIVDIIQPVFKWKDEEIYQLNTLEDHRQALKNAFISTSAELNIVSPYLRVDAVQRDSIPELIRKFCNSISINIYTDPELNKKHLGEFENVKNVLKKAGAQVIEVNKLHSKIITVDQRVIIEGSFNWLSASRTVEEYKRQENSILYKGKYASRFIQEAMEPIINKVKTTKTTLN